LYRISQSKSHGADAKDRPKSKESRQDIKQVDGEFSQGGGESPRRSVYWRQEKLNRLDLSVEHLRFWTTSRQEDGGKRRR
jgi:hypothetical protein